MASRHREAPTEPEAELFEVRLESIEREYDTDFDAEVYQVEFHCDGPHGQVFATVLLATEKIATLEIVPRAMSDLHLLFAALAKQSQAWRIEST